MITNGQPTDLSKREDGTAQPNSEVIRLNGEVARLNESLEKEQGKVQTLNEKVTKLNESLEKEQGKVQTLNEKVTKLNESLEKEQGKVTKLTKDLKEEQDNVKQLKRDKNLWCILFWGLVALLVIVYAFDPMGWRKSRSVTYIPTPSQLQEYEKKSEEGGQAAQDIYDEISVEMSYRFGSSPEFLYPDFTFDADSEWEGKKLYAVGEPQGVLMYTDDFVQKFNAAAKTDSLERARDGSNFSIDINDEGFDPRKTLEGLLHRVNQSNTGTSSNKNIVTGRIKERLEKSGRSYNYVRFVIKTNINGVDELAVFSIAPNDSPRFKGLYIASGRDILTAKSDSIINSITDKIEVQSDSLKFTLSPSEYYLRGYEDTASCLEKFIEQFK